MKRILFISVILALVLTGCYKEPQAMFDYYPTNPVAGEYVDFENRSVDAEAVEWSFGDGFISTSWNPSHKFDAGGKYQVQLKAMGKKGELDVYSVVVDVESVSPEAVFSFTPLEPIKGEDVFFTNSSQNYVSVEWDFGDGTISNTIHPSHAYAAAGSYDVELTVTGPEGDEDIAAATIVVGALKADFWVSTDLPGESGDVATETDVIFTGELITLNNISAGATTYLWDFGDGYTSTEESPQLSYDTPGTYVISLLATTGGESEQISKTIEIYEGINSCVRITVLEYYDVYPVENASVLLYGSLSDWEDELNPSPEVFTSAMGKCVFEGLNEQVYYVDVWEANHDNLQLAEEDVGFIETQNLEAGYIHDFIAYVDHYDEGKKHVTLTRAAQKKIVKEVVSNKKSRRSSEGKTTKYSKER